MMNATIEKNFQTGDVTISIPDGISVYSVKLHAKPNGIYEGVHTFPTEKFLIKEIFIPEEAFYQGVRCFGDRMIIETW